jgi:hypothetical protein
MTSAFDAIFKTAACGCILESLDGITFYVVESCGDQEHENVNYVKPGEGTADEADSEGAADEVDDEGAADEVDGEDTADGADSEVDNYDSEWDLMLALDDFAANNADYDIDDDDDDDGDDDGDDIQLKPERGA